MTNPYLNLEDPICNAHSMAAILLDRLHTHFEKSHESVTGHSNYFFLSGEEIECLLFAAGQIKRAISSAKTEFYQVTHAERTGQKLVKAA